ncbi:hypothetical protein AAFC00_003408 [Neodothiora populina]|uniref:Uncharacterized protein n=1 Tax=Neodothiora populina TaxID=2781224 RepID=A0ABR3PE24_9PEZI
MYALKRLFDMSQDEQLRNDTTCHCVMFFDSLLTEIEHVATYEAEAQSAENPPQKPGCEQRVQDNSDTIPRNVHTYLISQLTNLILAILDHMNTETPSSKQLLEGLLYFLFVRLGEIEHVIAFSGPKYDGKQDELRNLPPSDDETRRDHVRRLERRAMTTEAPYMLAILRKALKVVPEEFLDTNGNKEGKSRKHRLTSVALRRLQRTLIDCIMGPGTRGDAASADVLKMPILIGQEMSFSINSVDSHASGQATDTAVEAKEEWFEKELWATIGWEILGREEEL